MSLLCGPALYGAMLFGGISASLDAPAPPYCADWDSGPVWVYCKKDGSRTFGEVEYHIADRRPGATLVFGDVASKQVTPYRLPNGYAVFVLHDSKDAVLVRLFAELGGDHAVGVCRLKFADGKVWSCRPGQESIPYAGNGLEHLQEIRQLPGLNLSGTKLTAKQLQCLKELPNLQWLNLSRTNFTDKDVPLLSGLKELRHLHLHHTCVTAQGVKRLAELLPEVQIEFRHPGD